MVDTLKVVSAFLAKNATKYFTFNTKEDDLRMRQNAPDWTKVHVKGETRFYPPGEIVISPKKELGFNEPGPVGSKMLREYHDKGFISLRDPLQIKIFRENNPKWVKHLLKHETRFYPPDGSS